MNNFDVFVLLIIIGIMNILLKISAVYLGKEPKNKYIKKFFEYMPFSVLTYLVFPKIFVSVGNSKKDIFIVIIACFIVAYLCIKNVKLYKILILSTMAIILLKFLI